MNRNSIQEQMRRHFEQFLSSYTTYAGSTYISLVICWLFRFIFHPNDANFCFVWLIYPTRYNCKVGEILITLRNAIVSHFASLSTHHSLRLPSFVTYCCVVHRRPLLMGTQKRSFVHLNCYATHTFMTKYKLGKLCHREVDETQMGKNRLIIGISGPFIAQ